MLILFVFFVSYGVISNIVRNLAKCPSVFCIVPTRNPSALCFVGMISVEVCPR